MIKPELLAPAGDLERLKWAINYGADAVYFGGPAFGLRANAINFTMEDIKNTMFIGKTAYICSIIQRQIDNDDNNFEFDWKGIKESERKTVAELYREKESEIPIEDMGYNY